MNREEDLTDIRILKTIETCIKDFTQKRISTPILINSIGNYLNNLIIVDNVWKCHFDELWVTLETRYASDLFKGYDDINPNNQEGLKIFYSSLQEMLNMTVEKLMELKKEVSTYDSYYDENEI